MELRKEKKEEQVRLEVTQLDDRITPSVAIDVLGVATADVHLDLQAHVATPIGANVDVGPTVSALWPRLPRLNLKKR